MFQRKVEDMTRTIGVLLTLLIGSAASLAQNSYGTDVSAMAAFPVGTYSEDFKTGYGANLGFFMTSGSSTRYELTLGYMRMGLDNEGINQSAASNGQTGSYNVSGSIIAYPILIGVKFVPAREGFKPYGILEFGLYMYSKKFDGGTYTSPAGAVTQYSPSSSFRSEPGFNLGVGFLFPAGKDVSVDVALRYNLVKDSQYYNLTPSGGTSTYVGTNQYFTLNVGLSYAYLTQ
jgi:hypothetical protein